MSIRGAVCYSTWTIEPSDTQLDSYSLKMKGVVAEAPASIDARFVHYLRRYGVDIVVHT